MLNGIHTIYNCPEAINRNLIAQQLLIAPHNALADLWGTYGSLWEASVPPLHSSVPPLHSSVPPLYSSVPLLHSSVPPLYSSVPPLHSSVPPLHSSVPPLHSSVPPLQSIARQTGVQWGLGGWTHWGIVRFRGLDPCLVGDITEYVVRIVSPFPLILQFSIPISVSNNASL